MKRQEAWVRCATDADVASIERCAKLAYSIYVERIGRQPAPMCADFREAVARAQVVVVCNSSGIAGYAIYYPRNGSLFLENIAILPDQQRRGLGDQLLDHLYQVAAEQRFAAIELYTNAKMTENLAWYAKRGFVETQRVREDGFDRVYFSKQI